MSYVQGFIEFLKLKPRHLAAMAAVAGLALFLPDQIRERLGVVQLTEDYRPYIGITLVVAVSFLTMNMAENVANRISHAMRRRKAVKRCTQYLHGLTEHEKEVLWLYLSEQTKTQTFALGNGVVNGLVTNGILYRAADYGPFASFDYNLTDHAWRYLNDNAHLVIPEDVKRVAAFSECVED